MARNRSAPVANKFGIDTTDLHDLAKALRKAAPELSKDLRTDLRKAGAIVATEAKKKASEHSKSIPPTIKLRAAGATVAVSAGKGVPLAGLYELGNKGGKPGSFRHPLFGDWSYPQVQKGYPFLAVAAEATIVETEKAVGEAVERCVEHIAIDYGGKP